MADHSQDRPFATRLLEQETRISDARYAEYRRKIDGELARAAGRERRMRAVILGMLMVVLLGLLVFYAAAALSSWGIPVQHILKRLPDTAVFVIAIIIGTAYLTCVVCLIPFYLLYFLRYRRHFHQTQQDQILAILLELERQVAELREREKPDRR
jgi:hypothetical protein